MTGAREGELVGMAVVGTTEGNSVGPLDGARVTGTHGASEVGGAVGGVGINVGINVGSVVGESDGSSVGLVGINVVSKRVGGSVSPFAGKGFIGILLGESVARDPAGNVGDVGM
jgi:hypothetical protein